MRGSFFLGQHFFYIRILFHEWDLYRDSIPTERDWIGFSLYIGINKYSEYSREKNCILIPLYYTISSSPQVVSIDSTIFGTYPYLTHTYTRIYIYIYICMYIYVYILYYIVLIYHIILSSIKYNIINGKSLRNMYNTYNTKLNIFKMQDRCFFLCQSFTFLYVI
jgi:hypothetical protein